MHRADAIVEAAAARALRKRDPAISIHPVFAGNRIPAARLGPDIFGEIGEIEQLVLELERVVERPHDDVGSGADIGGDRRFRSDVVPAFGVDAHLDAGLLSEFLGIGDETVELRLDELLPAQDPDRSASFRRRPVPRRLGAGNARHEKQSRRAAGLQNSPSGDVGHVILPLLAPRSASFDRHYTGL